MSSDTQSQANSQSTRPRPRPGEHVEGMVEGEIFIYRRRGRSGGEIESFEVNTMPPFYVGAIPIYPPHEVRYSSPVPAYFTFTFVIDKYPSGPVTVNEMKAWKNADFDVLWESEPFLDTMSSETDTPAETPDYRRVIDDLVKKTLNAGWKSAGHGQYWFSYRLRRRYDELVALNVWLNWK